MTQNTDTTEIEQTAEDIKEKYGTTQPRKEQLTTGEKLAVAGLTPDELDEMFFEWVRENTERYGHLMRRDDYVRIYYSIPGDEIKASVAASPYQLHTVNQNKQIPLYSKKHSQDATGGFSDVVSGLAGLVNDSGAEYDWIQERYGDYAEVLELADIHQGEGSAKARDKLMTDEEFMAMYKKDQIAIELVVADEYTDIRVRLSHIDIAGRLRRRIERGE